MTAIVLRGDARQLPLPDGCVDLIVTSVPYWGLRQYTDGGKPLEGQIGGEATPGEWLEALWGCTREWMRVLKPEGNLFVNCGDKYDSGTTTARVNPGTVKDGQGQGWHQATPRVSLGRPKSLLGLPWRYAIGCTDRLGLILRAEIVWSKPNGLPESVTDRVRRSHEQVFHFTRSPRYYAAVDEIREPHAYPDWKRLHPRNEARQKYAPEMTGHKNGTDNPLGKLPGSVWPIPSAPLVVPAHLGVDHFAAFPPALVRPLVLGWSPPGVCTGCGQGRRPVSERATMRRHNNGRHGPTGLVDAAVAVAGSGRHGKGASTLDIVPDYRITGYACACSTPRADGSRSWPLGYPPPTLPAIVLDPFAGTGTTMLVASAYGRVGIGVDRSADYCRLARWRCSDPGERARARDMPKPPPIPDGMEPLFTM